MPKLFKHVNCPANFFSAFDKPCIPLKTSMKSLFMSRNGHDKSMTKMYGNGLMFWVKEWTFKPRNDLFLFRNGLIAHIGCKAGAMALSFIQCSHSHKILFFLSYYIHCYVFQLVCQYDDTPLASLIYCKRTFFPMCRMSGNVNTLVYFYLTVCTSVFIP